MTKKELITLLDDAILKVDKLGRTICRISLDAEEKLAAKYKKAA